MKYPHGRNILMYYGTVVWGVNIYNIVVFVFLLAVLWFVCSLKNLLWRKAMLKFGWVPC